MAAINIFAQSLKRHIIGFDKIYERSAEQVVCRIISRCWNGRYFQASTGHFNCFYMRDFGLSTPALAARGYKDECEKTLKYALQRFRANNRITTTIEGRKARDYFDLAPDSLAFLLQSLRIINNRELVSEYAQFIESEAARYARAIAGPDGLVKPNMYFSSMRDCTRRSSSCYDNVMLAVASRELHRLKLRNPFDYKYKDLIRDHFFNRSYFKDELGKDLIGGDANIMPFFMGLYDNQKMLKSCIEAIQEAGLDKPFPLKYSAVRVRRSELLHARLFVPNYQGDTIWSSLGLIYMNLLREIDKEEYMKVRAMYTLLINHHKTLPEIFTQRGGIYSTAFYHSDEGMLWSALFL